jgi:homoserine dehydrogenase
MSVVSDIIEIGRNLMTSTRPARHRPHEQRPLMPIADVRSRYYLRFAVRDQPGVLGQLATILGMHKVSIQQVVQDAAGDPVWVVVITHDAREGDVRAALAEIDRLCVAQTRVIRIAS